MDRQEKFADLLEKFLDEHMSPEELTDFLTIVKERKEDIFIQDTILDKLETAAYGGLGEKEQWRELYERSLLKARQEEKIERTKREGGRAPAKRGSVRGWSAGKKGRLAFWMRSAAAVFVLLLGLAAYLFINDGYREKKEGAMDPAKLAAYPRYITLEDGSSVVLNVGSTLEVVDGFDAPGDKGNGMREVRLKGEAYFDIKEDVRRPFVIYTGNVKTTVLGTAFNIKAYPLTSTIIVSVTSGKVKVEREKQMLALLNKDQQMVYNVSDEAARQEVVNAKEVVTDWARRDMVFDEVSFEAVAELIGMRYGVNIEFKNPLLKGYTIKASFNGTESLENVLKVLTTISNSNYTIKEDKYIIN